MKRPKEQASGRVARFSPKQTPKLLDPEEAMRHGKPPRIRGKGAGLREKRRSLGRGFSGLPKRGLPGDFRVSLQGLSGVEEVWGLCPSGFLTGTASCKGPARKQQTARDVNPILHSSSRSTKKVDSLSLSVCLSVCVCVCVCFCVCLFVSTLD